MATWNSSTEFLAHSAQIANKLSLLAYLKILARVALKIINYIISTLFLLNPSLCTPKWSSIEALNGIFKKKITE
jgi:hypothetical protein